MHTRVFWEELRWGVGGGESALDGRTNTVRRTNMTLDKPSLRSQLNSNLSCQFLDAFTNSKESSSCARVYICVLVCYSCEVLLQFYYGQSQQRLFVASRPVAEN